MTSVQKEGEDYLNDVQIALEQKHNELESLLRWSHTENPIDTFKSICTPTNLYLDLQISLYTYKSLFRPTNLPVHLQISIEIYKSLYTYKSLFKPTNLSVHLQISI